MKRFRGSGEEFATKVPAGAAGLKTFSTRDNPTTEVFKPTGHGLELVPATHPANIVAREAANFRFLSDGEPAAGHWMPGSN